MNCNTDDKKKCLILSSKAPSHSGYLGKDLITLFEGLGYYVDFVTLFQPTEPNPNDKIMGVIKENVKILERIKRKLRPLYQKPTIRILKNIIDKSLGRENINREGKIEIRYSNEITPAIDPQLILDKLSSDYKFILTLFWEPLVNTTTLKILYDKLKCPVLIYAVDMAPLTGGCYYFADCRNYMLKCKNCPGLSNPDSTQSHDNFMVKKANYNSMDVWWLGNTYMNNFASQSLLFNPGKICKVSLYMDSDFYRPLDRDKIRRELKLPNNSFIILALSSHAVRKGSQDVITTLDTLKTRLVFKELSKVFLITIGDSLLEKGCRKLGIPVKNFGVVPIPLLVKIYNASDVFLCTSKDDAGPSMVNQSILCGTPVITYDSGTAMDIIKNGESGFKAHKNDTNSLTSNLRDIIKMTPQTYQKLRNTTRELGLKYNSIEAGKEVFSKILTKSLNRNVSSIMT